MIMYIDKTAQRARDRVLFACKRRWYYGERFRGYTIEQAQNDMPTIERIDKRLKELSVLGYLRQEILPHGKYLYIYKHKKTT